MNTRPDISIALLTLNGMATLPAVFEAIATQQGVAPPEIVAVDSGSHDGSVQFMRMRGARVKTIEPEHFNHGATRNLALSECRGRLAVLLVQDAVPASPNWLLELTLPFASDSTLAGTFARQTPRPGASALTRWALAGWVASGERPHVTGPLKREEFARYTPAERHQACLFDNVCSCIRRDVWQRHPFQAVPIAEDLEWARDVLLAGHRIAYVPTAVVYHSHERSTLYEWRRTRLVHRRLYELFGLSTIPTGPSLMRAVASTLPQHMRIAARDAGFGSIARAAALAVAWPAGQYLGARDARRDRPSRSIRGI